MLSALSRHERDPEAHAPKAGAGPVDNVPLDTMYDVLRNRRRRLVLHYLVETPGHRAIIGTLATQIAAWENDIPVASVTSKQRKRTYNTLQQNHLSKMDDAGVLVYDRHRGTVELTAKPRQLEVFLTALPKTGSPWTKAFLLAGFVLWLILMLNWLSVHVFHVYSPGAGVTVTGFTLFLVMVGFIHVLRLLR